MLRISSPLTLAARLYPQRGLERAFVLFCFTAIVLLACKASVRADQESKKDQSPEVDGLKALSHPDADVRLRAAQLLCDLGPIGKFAIPALHERLKIENDAVIRVKVAEALWIIEKPAARSLLPVLVAALADKDETARANAANVIGQIGPAAKSATPDLAKLLQDKDLTVRVEAALALGNLGPAAKSSVPHLLQTLKNGQDYFLEPFVLGTLGKIGAAAVPELKDALNAKEPRLRRGAAYALGLIGPAAADAVVPLGKMLDAPEADLRALAARALGKIGKEAKPTAPMLQMILTDKTASCRIEAAVALWHVAGSSAGLPVLLEAIKDSDAKVREKVCRALGEMSGSKLVPTAPLEGALTDPVPGVRVAAVEALGTLGESASTALPALRRAFKDPSSNVRAGAAKAVWRIDRQAKDSVAALVVWLGDKDQDARRAAAVALGEIGPNALPAWDALLALYRDDPTLQVQRAAGIALKQIDFKAAVKAGVR